jgi:hypothetical protein
MVHIWFLLTANCLMQQKKQEVCFCWKFFEKKIIKTSDEFVISLFISVYLHTESSSDSITNPKSTNP